VGVREIKFLIIGIFIITNSLRAEARQCRQGDRPDSGCTVTVPTTANNGVGVQTDAQDAQGSNAGGSAFGQMGVAIGAATVARGMACCSGHCTSGCPLIPPGLAAIAAGMMLQGTHGAAGAGARNTEMTATEGNGGTMTADQFNKSLPTHAEYIRAMAKLEGSGVKIKDGKMTLPNGKSLSMSDAQDPSKLGAALGQDVDANAFGSGLNALMSKAKEKAAAAMKDYNGVDLNSLDGPSTSGGGGSSAMNMDMSAGANMKAAHFDARSPADVAGMKKKLGDSYIGVANDSIFGMMNRRYELKGNQNAFILATPSAQK